MYPSLAPNLSCILVGFEFLIHLPVLPQYWIYWVFRHGALCLTSFFFFLTLVLFHLFKLLFTCWAFVFHSLGIKPSILSVSCVSALYILGDDDSLKAIKIHKTQKIHILTQIYLLTFCLIYVISYVFLNM